MSVNLKKITLGFIPANRGFFSAQLAAKMRKQTIEAMEAVGIEVVVPGEEDTKVGCVENIREAELCADLFRKKDVQGIVIGAVNFGDEQGGSLDRPESPPGRAGADLRVPGRRNAHDEYATEGRFLRATLDWRGAAPDRRPLQRIPPAHLLPQRRVVLR